MTLTEQVLSQLPGDMLGGLRKADQRWQSLKAETVPAPNVVEIRAEVLTELDWDVVICGGTLGVLLGAALAQRGWRVALLEKGPLRGREQEWNISRHELSVLVELGLLSQSELEAAIATEYNPARISFLGGANHWVTDVLNVGVYPVRLLETLKQKFLTAGGGLFEQTAFEFAIVHPNGVAVQAGDSFKTRLLIDVMGHFSPIAQQARAGQKPDAVCLVVGSCAEGFEENKTGDLMASFTPIRNQCQYFWEAFPAKDGRTTYLFTYLDAHPSRPDLETLFEEYLTLLPTYQQVSLEQLKFKRALFGFFPCYKDSPLRFSWNRMLAAGDSSGSQSPLSFGGFGAMIRHLKRLAQGIDEALTQDLLTAADLGKLQPYQPNLSVTWLFQKSMSVGVEQTLPENRINEVLAAIFQDMAQLGDPVLKPFLQDVVQFPALAQTLLKTSVAHPLLVAKIVPQVGLESLIGWMGHYANLAAYSALHPWGQLAKPWAERLSPQQRYGYHRWLEALKYGSGQDY
ncbi:MAG: FAD-binding oxidoreductase [Leptolyngbyaceae cyanobacterium SM1_1_3]|nr:FAD-binding oxidoreductase [Leptolyngbyaceae cyanobacterium SM1_1_3]NJN02463.1 FAD-binding oxidoreductase [Leptolyngbyaceae cyanobacterium RM1_1_2]NJO10190.1 FAD-binding oxidoreductase [Leptolyngbyaceae cyanobacterium SL_1_1]